MKTSRLIKCALGAIAAISLACSSYGIPVNIIAGTTASVGTGNQTSQDEINDAIAPIIGNSVELYKAEAPGGGESGPLAASYATTFNADASGGLIDYISGTPVGPTSYLLVKDGAQVPAWYLYNLTGLGWTGTEDVTFSNFWPAQGAISHITLYSGSSVPDAGSTVLLLGAGLAALGFIRRRK